MQNNRFVVLTGHLSNYPLQDLVGILRHQRKSGRLLIEYPKGPATFFFQNGELIDARMNELIGLQAICVALAQPEASFNFNPLIQSPRRTIDPSLQRAVSELFGCWDESAQQIETTPAAPSLEGTNSTSPGNASRALPGRRSELLALPPGPTIVVQRRSLLLIAAAVVIVIGLSTVIAVTGAFKEDHVAATPSQQSQNQPAPVAAAPAEIAKSAIAAAVKSSRSAIERRDERRKHEEKRNSEPAAQSETPVPAKEAGMSSSQAIKVVMQIENGRVLKASIANHKPGMDSYEALALRIARQRRFPATVSGGETVTVTVSRPEQ
ncbi:MAG TPA: DUF4388 domain-containing protein [Pyrinomonadaceae bacterium]|nr:DUF4388 domain-containing protein [Pyrinomonadaceae bacterium]